MSVTILLTIDKIMPLSIRVSTGGDNPQILFKEHIRYEKCKLKKGAEIEITMSEEYAIRKELV